MLDSVTDECRSDGKAGLGFEEAGALFMFCTITVLGAIIHIRHARRFSRDETGEASGRSEGVPDRIFERRGI